MLDRDRELEMGAGSELVGVGDQHSNVFEDAKLTPRRKKGDVMSPRDRAAC